MTVPKRCLVAVLMVCASVSALAQSNYVSITTANANEITAGPNGAGMAQGSFCAYATDTNDRAIAFEVGGLYQSPKESSCVAIANGQFSSSLQLANPSQTLPLYIRYHVTITDTLTGAITQYPLVSIIASGSSWDWSSWNPSAGTLPPLAGFVQTINGLPGAWIFTGPGISCNGSLLTCTVTPPPHSVAAAIVLAAPYMSAPPPIPVYTVPALSAITWSIPANCASSSFTSTAAATGVTTFTVSKNGSPICVGTVEASGTTITWSSGNSATTLAASDALSVTYSGDATLTGALQINATQTN